MKQVSLIIFLLILLLVSTPSVRAQEQTTPFIIETDTLIGNTEGNSSTMSAVTSSKVNYELAYPGMLPDNPLYFLKAIRDKIVKMLIADNYKEAEFNLLTSDKRMYAAQMLSKKEKYDDAYSTLTKSTNYLYEALPPLSVEKKVNPKNTEVRPFLHTLDTASKKHIEVVDGFIKTFPKEYKGKLETEKERIIQFESKVISLLAEKK